MICPCSIFIIVSQRNPDFALGTIFSSVLRLNGLGNYRLDQCPITIVIRLKQVTDEKDYKMYGKCEGSLSCQAKPMGFDFLRVLLYSRLL